MYEEFVPERLAKLRLQKVYLHAICHCRWGRQTTTSITLKTKITSCHAVLLLYL